MKKNLLIAAIAITALASCTSNDYVGDQSPQGSNETYGAISFDMNTPAVTRATGGEAATLLNNNFVVFAYKTTGSTNQTVFDNYQVKYVTNTANTTESNSAGWEYVGYDSKLATPVTQSIKYWDFNADSYDFFAYSLGGQTAAASVMTNSTYTLKGDIAKLGACYISKKKHLTMPLSTPTSAVQLEFINFLSKIQLKFFETIPGYAVKDLKFYNASGTLTDSDNSGDPDGKVPALYGADNSIKTGGQYEISFDASYNPVVTLTSGDDFTHDSKVEFDDISSGVYLDNYATTLDYKEAEAVGQFLAREATAATSTKQISVIPNPTGATLTLKMDYTLVSRDGTGETIKVTGATATLPATFTQWKPNYAYTYIFKITDDKLVPITLDAIVTDAQDGSQETITTVSDPSITTYAKTNLADNEYRVGNIYVVVNNGVTLTTTGESINAKLYTATIEAGAAQSITEETVANALAVGTTDGNSKYVTDANGKKLTVTLVGSDATDKLEACTEIPADDAPGGKAFSITGAKFKALHTAYPTGMALAAGTAYYSTADATSASTLDAEATTTANSHYMKESYYVFEYTYETTKKAYKVIKIQ